MAYHLATFSARLKKANVHEIPNDSLPGVIHYSGFYQLQQQATEFHPGAGLLPLC